MRITFILSTHKYPDSNNRIVSWVLGVFLALLVTTFTSWISAQTSQNANQPCYVRPGSIRVRVQGREIQANLIGGSLESLIAKNLRLSNNQPSSAQGDEVSWPQGLGEPDPESSHKVDADGVVRQVWVIPWADVAEDLRTNKLWKTFRGVRVVYWAAVMTEEKAVQHLGILRSLWNAGMETPTVEGADPICKISGNRLVLLIGRGREAIGPIRREYRVYQASGQTKEWLLAAVETDLIWPAHADKKPLPLSRQYEVLEQLAHYLFYQLESTEPSPSGQ